MNSESPSDGAGSAANIFSISSRGKLSAGSAAIENTRLSSPFSSTRARKATEDLVSLRASLSAESATSDTVLKRASSTDADSIASKTCP